MVSLSHDIFEHQRKLDYHDQYHLHCISLFGLDLLETSLFQELNQKHKQVQLTTSLLFYSNEFEHFSDESNYEQEIVNTLFDPRFDLFKKYSFKSFLEISESDLLMESFQYITPSFF